MCVTSLGWSAHFILCTLEFIPNSAPVHYSHRLPFIFSPLLSDLHWLPIMQWFAGKILICAFISLPIPTVAALLCSDLLYLSVSEEGFRPWNITSPFSPEMLQDPLCYSSILYPSSVQTRVHRSRNKPFNSLGQAIGSVLTTCFSSVSSDGLIWQKPLDLFLKASIIPTFTRAFREWNVQILKLEYLGLSGLILSDYATGDVLLSTSLKTCIYTTDLEWETHTSNSVTAVTVILLRRRINYQWSEGYFYFANTRLLANGERKDNPYELLICHRRRQLEL